MRPARARRRKTPPIDVQIKSPKWKAEPSAAATVRKAIAAAASAARKSGGEVNVVLADDAVLRALNRDWLGIDKPTNVLSFPARVLKAGMRPAPAGDIVIAFETVKRESAKDGIALRHHLAHLAVHGFLHLMGYDHQTDKQADVMEGLERDILARLRIADPYRTHDA
jgi:probable rRNA maturation factor